MSYRECSNCKEVKDSDGYSSYVSHNGKIYYHKLCKICRSMSVANKYQNKKFDDNPNDYKFCDSCDVPYHRTRISNHNCRG